MKKKKDKDEDSLFSTDDHKDSIWEDINTAYIFAIIAIILAVFQIVFEIALKFA